jgi:hypothetical protein
VVLSAVLPRVLNSADTGGLESGLRELIDLLKADIPIEIDAVDLHQFANFALDRFLDPAPVNIANLVMTALYFLQIRERELSHILNCPSFVGFLTAQLWVQIEPDILASILNVCAQFVIVDAAAILPYIASPALNLLGHSDPLVLSCALDFFCCVFATEIEGKRGLGESFVPLLAALLAQCSDIRVTECAAKLFEIFVQSGLCLALIPGGVECYNAVLKCENPGVIYRTLGTLAALLARPGDQIAVLRDSLDWRRLLWVLENGSGACISQALVCFSNLASFGEDACLHLRDIGLLESIFRLMEVTASELKVEALECLCGFMEIPTIVGWAVFETPFLDLVGGILPTVKGERLARIIERLICGISHSVQHESRGWFAERVATSGIMTILEELLESEILVAIEQAAITGFLQFLNDHLLIADL